MSKIFWEKIITAIFFSVIWFFSWFIAEWLVNIGRCLVCLKNPCQCNINKEEYSFVIFDARHNADSDNSAILYATDTEKDAKDFAKDYPGSVIEKLKVS